MEAAKARFEDEIGVVESCEIEVIPTLIIGPMGDFCGGCWEDGPCTVVVHMTGPLDGVERTFDFSLHRGCAAEWIRRNTLYAPAMVVELGLYADNIEDTAHLSRVVPAADITVNFDYLPPCELED